MQQIINRKIYDTNTASRVTNRGPLNHGRTSSLYKTEKGNFFIHSETIWDREYDVITPISEEEAKEVYEAMPYHDMDWETAFGEVPEEA